MATSLSINLQTKEWFTDALEAYKTVSSLSESELETLAILSNQKDKDLILAGISESKNNQIHSIRSILD